MPLQQRFKLRDGQTETLLLELDGSSAQGHMHLREYMLSLFRLRALDNLLATKPKAAEVMRFMANIHEVWADFHSAQMRIEDSDVVDLLAAFESANLEYCEEVAAFLATFRKSHPTGILIYSATT